MAQWPSSLPQYPLRDGYNREPVSSRLSFQVDAGTPKERNRATAMPENVTERYFLTTAQKNTLETFWRTTTKRGVIPFTKINPETNTNRLYQIIGEVGSGDYVDGQHWIITLSLRLLP